MTGGTAGVEVLSTDRGDVVASNGFALYVFTPDDGAATPTCNGDCAALWPPLLSEGAPTAAAGIDSAGLTTVTREDGTQQVALRGHPLYFYAPDSAGETKGQGVGGQWFLIGPTGSVMSSDSASPATTMVPGGYGGYGY